MYKKKSRKV